MENQEIIERLPINYVPKEVYEERKKRDRKKRQIFNQKLEEFSEKIKEDTNNKSLANPADISQTYELPSVSGRPPLGRADPQKNLFLEVFAKNEGRQGRTCKELGIKLSKLKYWKNNDPEFEDEYNLILMCIIEEVEKNLIKQGSGELKGNALANIAVLNARGRMLGYGLRQSGVKDLVRDNTKDAIDKFYDVFKIDKQKRKILATEKVKYNIDGSEIITKTIKVDE